MPSTTPEMPSLPAQLRARMLDLGLSVQAVLDRCVELDKNGDRPPRVECSRSALDRKLKGEIRMNAEEIQACAEALGVTVQWPPTKIDAASLNDTSTDATAAEAAAS